MLEGVKALFKFTMAILHLAFKTAPPSSCEVFSAIRNTASDLTDIDQLLSIVAQIKLPKDSYFAIRRSFYMVQSSFCSDQFYMQSLTNDVNRQMVTNKPINMQQLPDTKQPAVSLMTASSFVNHKSFRPSSELEQSYNTNDNSVLSNGTSGARVCTSSDKTKVCIQNIGKLGRSHIRVLDSNAKTAERSLMNPLRNCLVVGISNCGRNIILVRQSSRKNFKTFCEQDLVFQVYELNVELFDGFYMEADKMILVLSHTAEVFKINTTTRFNDSHQETLILRDQRLSDDEERVNLRLASLDPSSKLLWIYLENEELDMPESAERKHSCGSDCNRFDLSKSKRDMKISESTLSLRSLSGYRRKIMVIDLATFDIFSAFEIDDCFGEIISLRTSLVAFCQMTNSMSNQFSSRIVKIGPTGVYEHLLSSSDVVDFMVNLVESDTYADDSKDGERFEVSVVHRANTTVRSFLNSIIPGSESQEDYSRSGSCTSETECSKSPAGTSGTLSRYCRSILASAASKSDGLEELDAEKYNKLLQEDRTSLDTSSGSQSSRLTGYNKSHNNSSDSIR